MNLRDYQSSAVDAVLANFADGSSTLGVAATGLGKTIVFAHLINLRRGSRALVLAHREELVRQAADKIVAITGERPDIEMAGERADHALLKARVVVASKDTLRGRRLERFDPLEFGTLITDEAHHAIAGSYGGIFAHFGRNPNLKHLGVTATPDRTDEAGLGRVYGSVAFEYDIRFGVREGWLVDITQRSVVVEGLDFSNVRTTAGDLNGADLARVMEQEKALHGIAHPTFELSRGRKTLVFAASLYHAELLCDILNRHRAGAAEWISGTTPRETRAAVLAAYRRGEFQFLVNVGVFTEGFDEPGIEVVAMARPTESRSLFAQMVGRGTRPLPGVVDGCHSAGDRRAAIRQSAKPTLEVLDFVGNTGKHKLVCVADVLGGRATDEVVETAARRVRERGGSVLDAIEAVEKELLAARELARRRHVLGLADYTVVPSDPFDLLGVVEWREPAWHKGKPATAAQINLLERAGVPDAKGLTFTKARQLIDEITKRGREGKVGYRQALKLAELGYRTDLPLGEAMNILSKARRAA